MARNTLEREGLSAGTTPYNPYHTPNSFTRHETHVDNIATAVKDFQTRQVPYRIYHGSTNSTRALNFSRDAIVDTSPLTAICALDATRRIVLVEPNVRMDTLVAAMVPRGLVPPIVPELPSITVGGAFAGTAGESSSFKHGFFDACFNWCEVVLGNGDVVRASPSENADLFEGCRGALGTLGVCTLFEMRLVPTNGWVLLRYLPVTGAEEMMRVVQERIKDEEKEDFVEGIMYGRDRGLVITGTLTEGKQMDRYRDLPRKSFTRMWDEWFYLHAEKVLDRTSISEKTNKIHSEVVSVKDYVFRYDRGGFWTGKYAFPMFYTPFNRVTRIVLNPLMKTERMYKALHHSGMSQRFIVQDVAIPLSCLAQFLDWVDKEFGIFPSWICPLRSDSTAIFQKGTGKQGPDIPFCNIGIWGPCSDKRYLNGKDWFARFIADNRMLEQKVCELGGLKCLYAHQYFTKEEFWDIFDKNQYDKLRQKWHAEGIPDVYEKVKPRLQPRPVQPIRGVLRLLLKRNHIFARSKGHSNGPRAQEKQMRQKSGPDSDDSSRASGRKQA